MLNILHDGGSLDDDSTLYEVGFIVLGVKTIVGGHIVSILFFISTFEGDDIVGIRA